MAHWCHVRDEIRGSGGQDGKAITVPPVRNKEDEQGRVPRGSNARVDTQGQSHMSHRM